MQLLLLIVSVALLCTGSGILIFFLLKNGGGHPWTWKLTPKESALVNIATACVVAAIMIIGLNGYIG